MNELHDVAIVGCGPTGVVLANLLGQLGVRVVVLERDRDVYPVPRATHIDEETLRNFQLTGLIDELWPHTSPFGVLEIADDRGRVLLRNEVADPKAPHGYTGSRFFDQPAVERELRAGLARYPSVTVHTGTEVTGLRDDGETVTIDALRDGEPFSIRAAWVVGCDGGRSVTREAVGASMIEIAPKRPWVIVDTLLRDPADAARLPNGFRYVLARERLSIYAHGFGHNRRWEYQLGVDEAVPSDDTVLSWVARAIDLDRVDVLRVAQYAHVALLASTWRKGRIFLAGDAAHMMPPSAGQGMCSGIRDAVNLAWKLHRVIVGASDERLLDSYEQERAPHVRETLLGTIFIGNRLLGDTVLQRWRRRLEMLAMSIPAIRELAREHGLRRPVLHEGFLDASCPLAGRFLPQFVSARNGVRSDDGLGYAFAHLRVGAPGLDAGLAAWMRDQRIDWVLVRPDRYIHSAGRGEWTGLQD